MIRKAIRKAVQLFIEARSTRTPFPLKKDFLPIRHNQKNVLVTGGGTGMGLEIAKGFYQSGSNVLITSRKENVLYDAVDQLKNNFNGNTIDYFPCDIVDRNQVKKLVTYMKSEYGGIDIVINNAAGNFISPSFDISENGWNKINDIVMKGTLNVTLEAGEVMRENGGGVFTNITSTYADSGTGYVVPSAIAKAGGNAMIRSLSVEWAKYGIRMNGIAPGPVPTKGAFSRLDPTGAFRIFLTSKNPSGRLGNPTEIANLALFLSSDYAGWINGQIITIDGGELNFGAGEFNLLNYLSETEWKIIKTLRK